MYQDTKKGGWHGINMTDMRTANGNAKATRVNVGTKSFVIAPRSEGGGVPVQIQKFIAQIIKCKIDLPKIPFFSMSTKALKR